MSHILHLLVIRSARSASFTLPCNLAPYLACRVLLVDELSKSMLLILDCVDDSGESLELNASGDDDGCSREWLIDLGVIGL